MKAYAGIGSRKTPPEILSLMTKSAVRLNGLGYTLRSGGANGADTAFELGAALKKEIYLPWRGFNSNTSHLYNSAPLAFAMAERYHPAWNRCSPAARKFHARNCHQILGLDLASPCEFVLCWTPRGEVTGGTGQALRLAQDWCVPIINMYKVGWQQKVIRVLDDVSGAAEQEQDQANERYIAEHFGDGGQPI